MSHEIMGERFISRVRPAWHDLGTLFPEGEKITASEAAKRVAGDIQIVKAPLSYKLGEVVRPVDKQVAIVRLPTPEQKDPMVFGVVNDSWKADSYPELAKALDKLSETYRVETAGLLRDGRLCFISFKGDSWDVAGDPMESYFNANLSLNPGQGHRMFHSPVRVVCWNTNNAALAQSSINLSIPHGADAKQQIGIAGNLAARFVEAQAKTKELCEAFAAKTCTVEEAESIFKAAFPEPMLPKKLQMVHSMTGGAEGAEMFKQSLDASALESLTKAQEGHEKAIKRQDELRETTRNRFHAFDPAHMRGTVWAAYNAATEVADWREGRNSAISSMWGTRAKEKGRAFAQAMTLVGAN